MIIGITGTYGAGKGTIVEFLKKNGFKHYSVTDDYLVPEIKRRNLPVNRDSMILVANDLRSKFGPGFIVTELYKIAKQESKNCVIESIRCVGEVEALKKQDDFYLFAVDANQETRYERVKKRMSSKDDVSFEDFCKKEALEMDSDDPNKQNIKKCIELSNFSFENNSTISDLYERVQKIITEIKNESS